MKGFSRNIKGAQGSGGVLIGLQKEHSCVTIQHMDACPSEHFAIQTSTVQLSNTPLVSFMQFCLPFTSPSPLQAPVEAKIKTKTKVFVKGRARGQEGKRAEQIIFLHCRALDHRVTGWV